MVMVVVVVTVATVEDKEVMAEDRVGATVAEMVITTTTMAMATAGTLAAVSPWLHHKRQHQLLVSGWLHRL